MLRASRCLAALASLAMVSPTGCRGAPTSPPYGIGQGPTVESLLVVSEPRMKALQVPRAKIRLAGQAGAGLELVAMAPDRFAGRVHVAHNALLQLAVNEEAYALRVLESRGGPDPGFYTGPPSECAVEALIGVAITPKAVTALLLGGAPLISGPHEVVEHGWHRRAHVPPGVTKAEARKRRKEGGRETLRVKTAKHEQLLEFAWIEGGWWFAGAALFRRDGSWLWTITHHDLHAHGGVVVPGQTRIAQSTDQGPMVYVIDYVEQVIDPVLPGTKTTEEPEWEEGWEDEEEGGEPPAENVEAPMVPPKNAIPPAFRLEGGGLTPHGDLCRG